MNAEILSIGTELLMGQISNTNAQFISKKLSELGISVFYHSVVGDNKLRASAAFSQAYARSDIIILTGGLGPTQDDITKDVVASVLDLKLVLDEKSLEHIKLVFKRFNHVVDDSNKKQAYFPKGSILLQNSCGTAPGCIVEKDNKIIILLPGPPKELIPMFDESVFPYLMKKNNNIIESCYIKVFGVGESKAESMLIDLISNQTNPTIATYVSEGVLLIRVTASGDDKTKVDNLICECRDNITKILGDYIFSYDNSTLEEAVGNLLILHKKTISIAESCTGGMISSLLTNVSGISKVFLNSVVSYSNEAKINILNVKEETLNKYGAVSKETAKEMAQGIMKISKTDIGISVTGIAGPEGGTLDKPVGLVYIGIATGNILKSYKFNFTGDRQRIRLMAALNALEIMRRNIQNQ